MLHFIGTPVLYSKFVPVASGRPRAAIRAGLGSSAAVAAVAAVSSRPRPNGTRTVCSGYRYRYAQSHDSARQGGLVEVAGLVHQSLCTRFKAAYRAVSAGIDRVRRAPLSRFSRD
ncbi:unnamed protein product, partial [Iphiclides podalirius]